MMKLVGKLRLFVILFILLFPTITNANSDYTITSYDVNIMVNENNTLNITEKIGAYFITPKHGIYRKIPIYNNVKRLDGSSSNIRAKISNIKVNNKYKISITNGYKQIQIGDADTLVSGIKYYEISYLYDLGKDKSKKYDELYFNIVGNEWDTSISNITFTITMPKEFDKSKIGFSSGYKGSTDSSNIVYNVFENTISGSYTKTLNANSGLTIRLELPEGYFVNAHNNINLYELFTLIIPVVLLFISFIFWKVYGKNKHIIETVEFYPPEGINSLETAYIYNETVKDKDVTSLLIYLANKGYIEIIDDNIEINAKKVSLSSAARKNADKKIIELQKKIALEKKNNPNSKKIKYYENMLDIYNNIDSPIDYEKYGVSSKNINTSSKNKFVIKKLKDYDGANLFEEKFLKGLFKYDTPYVTDKMLYNEFYKTNDSIVKDVKDKCHDLYFDKRSEKSKKIMLMFEISIFVIINILPVIEAGDARVAPFFLMFPGIAFAFTLYILFNEKSIKTKIFGIVFGALIGGFPWSFTILPYLKNSNIYLASYVIGIICIIIIYWFSQKPSRRTELGNVLYGKIKGFKNFLETVEKDKLNALVEENPNYFYDILPYTYVFGISDKWIKKFESISLKAPEWYNSSSDFDNSSINKFMHSTMNNVSKAMINRPVSSGYSSGSSSSSSSSSGGGSSGGGSGGGGGGSW